MRQHILYNLCTSKCIIKQTKTLFLSSNKNIPFLSISGLFRVPFLGLPFIGCNHLPSLRVEPVTHFFVSITCLSVTLPVFPVVHRRFKHTIGQTRCVIKGRGQVASLSLPEQRLFGIGSLSAVWTLSIDVHVLPGGQILSVNLKTIGHAFKYSPPFGRYIAFSSPTKDITLSAVVLNWTGLFKSTQ